MFYPQLVAGPIERPQNLLHQFHEYHPFDASNISKGLRQMLWGFFMKVVVADQMGVYVNTVYGAPGYQSGPSLLLATVCFAFQLYCDFAGYSNIAIGAGRTMGFHMMTNFRRPYFSRSISEFWKRWHISLGTWFRDYLYIPLGGNRVGNPRYYFNLMLTFLVSGLWHGASWNFVVWGGIHGALQVAEAITRKFRQRFGLDGNWGFLPILQGMYVFAFANLAWIFFRAPTWDQAIQIIRDIFTKGGKLFIGRGPDKFTLIYGGIAVLILLTVEFFDEFHPNSIQLLHNKNRTVRYATSFALLSYIMLLGVFSSSQFLYFQF
jgi:D-alanyl-lipoteichoic acid acyltransferase DltB (MBOAT superfamily)